MEVRNNSANIGLNLDSIPSQIKPGEVSFAMNAVVKGFDGKSVSYQNEQANTECASLPEGFEVIGRKLIQDRDIIVVFLTDGEESEIGQIKDCEYTKIINAPCLNFNIDYPIKKVILRESKLYFTDNNNPLRYIDLDNLPWLEIDGEGCENVVTNEVDCNKIRVQPKFSLPTVEIEKVTGDGTLVAGTYQFGIQYADSSSNGYTSFYAITNPIPAHDEFKITNQYDYPVNQSISLKIRDLDDTGIFDYINVAVIKTINDIPSVELVGTYDIRDGETSLVYSGQKLQDLTPADVFERFPVYDTAKDVFAVQDVLGWDGLKLPKQINYQKIFNKVKVGWETHRMDGKVGYKDPKNVAIKRGYMRDEVYALEAIVHHKDGSRSQRLHIPGRVATSSDLEPINNGDSVVGHGKCEPDTAAVPRWQVYNTGSRTGSSVPMCQEVIEHGGSTTSNRVNGTITLNCPDQNCTTQAAMKLNISLEKALPEPITVQIGMIEEEPLNGGRLEATGFDLFEIPDGVFANTYYVDDSLPFEFVIPANTTNFNIADIRLKGYTSGFNTQWICHGCLFPVRELYIKAISSKNIVINNTQGIPVHNIPVVADETTTIPPTTEVIDVPCVDDCYEGAYEYGEFAYWESTDLYPCDEEYWGELAGQPIRHHRFPDNVVTNHYDDDGWIYPIGIRVDVQQIVNLINNSDLTQEQKDNIAGIQIVRGNRAAHKRIVAKGHISNVLKYSTNDRLITTKNTVGSTGTNPTADTIDSAIQMLDDVPMLDFYGHGDEVDDIKSKANRMKELQVGDAEFTQKAEEIRDTLAGIVGDDDMSQKNRDKVEAVQHIFEALADTSSTVQETLEDIAEEEEEIDSDIDTAINTDGIHFYPNYLYNDVRGKDPFIDNDSLSVDEDAKFRHVFHSPDTHFYQPTLGNVLKVETAQYGKSISHIVETKRHAKYQFVNSNAYITSLLAGVIVGFASGQYGVSTKPFDGTAAFTAYNAMLSIIFKVTPRKNVAYQFNSVSNYNKWKPIPNNGNKIRRVDIAQYLLSGNYNVGDKYPVNNYLRESSVYLRTTGSLPFVHEQASVPKDISKLLFADMNFHESNIVSYYASLQNLNPAQWGQVFSYEAIDTGYYKELDLTKVNYAAETVFGGDIFINKFAYKTKFPFFIDHRVNPEGNTIYPDESDIFYNELSNVGKVRYWFSTDATKGNGIFQTIFGIRPHKFFMSESKFFNDNGKIFLFAYGIPYFWVESEVNVDMRQATNPKEGDFYPHVGSGIPDDWMQESFVPMVQDNVYHYNRTYSKQNKESFFHKPLTEEQENELQKQAEFMAIWSDKEDNQPRNNWLIYRPVSRTIFPQSYGKLIGVETVEDRAFIVRFTNKSLLYNVLQTVDVSNGQAAYLGNPNLFSNAPPLDYAETDLGYNGTQHAFFLKTEYGHITVDAKRGRVFLLSGRQAKDLTAENSMVRAFFERNMPFYMSKFPNFDIDNNYKGVGLHGTFNGKRLILTKIDYEPLNNDIYYDNTGFIYSGNTISLDNEEYFKNRSFTISFDFDSGRWISFHSYLPKYYVEGTKQFYSGITGSIWLHDKEITKYNNFYGTISPYILEYPFAYQAEDEVVQSVKDHTKVTKHASEHSFIVPNDIYFNKAILYNDEQCSGLRKLTPKPSHNLYEYRRFPKFNGDNIENLFVKSDNYYNYNGMWNVVISQSQPIFIEDGVFKTLNEPNMEYGNKAYRKASLRGKDLKIRHILDDKDEYRFVTQFLLTINHPEQK